MHDIIFIHNYTFQLLILLKIYNIVENVDGFVYFFSHSYIFIPLCTYPLVYIDVI